MSVNVWDREVPFSQYQTHLFVNGEQVDTDEMPGFSLIGWTVPEVVYQVRDTSERARAEFLYRVTVAEFIPRFTQLVDLPGGAMDDRLNGSNQDSPVNFRVELFGDGTLLYRREFLAWLEPEGVATAMPQAMDGHGAEVLAEMLFPSFDLNAVLVGAADVLSADALHSVASGALATYVLFQQMEQAGVVRHDQLLPDEPGVGWDSGRWSPDVVPAGADEDIEWLKGRVDDTLSELEAWLAEQTPDTDN